MQFVELPPGIRPARRSGNASRFGDRLVAAVGIGLQRAIERFEVLLRVDALAVRRIGKPDGRRRGVARRPVVMHIHPQASGFSVAVAWREYRHGRIVGMELRRRNDVSTQYVDERLQQSRIVTNPLRQQRAIQLDTFSRIDHRLPVER